MINVLLCCEGKRDSGEKIFIDDEYINIEGVMQIIIRKFYGRHELNFVLKMRSDIKKVEILGPKYSKHSTAARKVAQLAKKENCRYIAYHQDEDNKGFEKIYNIVKSYFSSAQESGLSCLAIVPKHMTENWLLSDENAFSKLFGYEPTNPALPKEPEEIWGNKGTEKHPKQYISNVLSQYHRKPSSEIYSDIAEFSDIETLKLRCPESFGKFCIDIKTFIEGESA